MMACDLTIMINGIVASLNSLNSTALEERILPNNLNNGCLDTLSLGANLLGLAIALLALVISCVAFLLPLMITAVGNYQSAFFNSVTNPQCTLAIKRIEQVKKVTDTIDAIVESTLFMNNIYRRIMTLSIVAFAVIMISIIGNALFFGSSRYLIYFLFLILFAYLLFLTYWLIGILRKMFKQGTKGSYVELAQLQSQIIYAIYEDTAKDSNIGADDRPEDVFLIYHKKGGNK